MSLRESPRNYSSEREQAAGAVWLLLQDFEQTLVHEVPEVTKALVGAYFSLERSKQDLKLEDTIRFLHGNANYVLTVRGCKGLEASLSLKRIATTDENIITDTATLRTIFESGDNPQSGRATYEHRDEAHPENNLRPNSTIESIPHVRELLRNLKQK